MRACVPYQRTSSAPTMAERDSDVQEYRSEKPKMPSAETYATEVRSWLVAEAESRRGRRKRVLAELAREIGLHTRRIAAYFYGEVRSPSAAEYELIRNWRDDELRKMARERIELSVKLEWIEARLNAREEQHGSCAALVGEKGGTHLQLAGEAVTAPVRLAGGEGLIADPRQLGLLE